jgi:excinuclease UvrABC ATPase subunit
MIYLTQIKDKSYSMKCLRCNGIGTIPPTLHDPRPAYIECDVCKGTGQQTKQPAVSERK